MRRNAMQPNRCLTTLFVLLTALLLTVVPAEAKRAQHRVIIKVDHVSRVSQLENKHGFRSKKVVGRGNSAIMVVEDIPLGVLKNALKNEAGIDFIEEDKAIALDGGEILASGERVQPLDGGETVLPLDGGETVLPLDAETDQKITQLLDGGETVLPLDELKIIRSAFSTMAPLVTPSRRLLIQPALRKIGLYPSVTRVTGRGLVVAVIDTGADSCHHALRGIVLYTFTETDPQAPENCATDSTPIVPGFGHGTATSSLVHITAPEAAIWAMRVFDNTGTALTSDIYEAIIYAADHGVNAINMSFGLSTPSQALTDAIAYAQGRGIVLIAAGGNSGVEGLMYPAANAGVKGVAGTMMTDVKAGFSNYGVETFVSAPGYGLWVAYPNNMLKYVAGTSYSAPLVTGEAALLIDAYRRQQSSSPTSSMIDGAMITGTVNIDSLNPDYAHKLGYGRIYIPAAVSATGLQ